MPPEDGRTTRTCDRSTSSGFGTANLSTSSHSGGMSPGGGVIRRVLVAGDYGTACDFADRLLRWLRARSHRESLRAQLRALTEAGEVATVSLGEHSLGLMRLMLLNEPASITAAPTPFLICDETAERSRFPRPGGITGGGGHARAQAPQRGRARDRHEPLAELRLRAAHHTAGKARDRRATRSRQHAGNRA